MKTRLTIIAAALLAAVSCGKKPLEITDLTTEMLENPEAVGTVTPRFGWKLVSKEKDVLQSTWRILAASDKALLEEGKADLWDSGTVASAESTCIPYGGRELASRAKVWWKVIVEAGGHETESSPQYFGTGLLEASDWKARWIGHVSPDDILTGKTVVAARYLRKEFKLARKIESAKLYACGLGVCELYINNNRIAPDEALSPTVSDYATTVYYNTFDVTDFLRKGRNALGVILGSGRYTSMRIPKQQHYDVPKLLLQLEVTYKDGSTDMIVSDQSWKVTSEGPIRNDNEFDGETYDASREMPGWTETGFSDKNWADALLVPAPGGVLKAQPNPNIAIQDRLRPVSITPLGDGWILDMGQNMVGWLKINGTGAAADTVSMRFAETLREDGSLYLDNMRTAEVTDRYIPASDGRFIWQPSFVYHGFRYVEVKGLAAEPQLSDFEGLVLYDRMRTTGSFSSSDAVLDRIIRNAWWGIRGNYRGMPTDCPQRDERMGWMGDRTTGCYGESYLFDNHLLYAKWLDDIADAQRPSGSIPDVAPAYWSYYTDNITWPGVFVTAADMIYRRFGDDRPIKKHYPAMKKWLAYMKDTYGSGGLITKDRYGDWCMPPESLELIHSRDPERITDGSLISTAMYAHLCSLMQDFAPVAGHPEDAGYFAAEAAASTEAFNRKFLDPANGSYDNGTVTANILPLYFGMVPETLTDKVFANIVDKTEGEAGGHVSCGVIGIQVLMRCLTDFGRGDLALKIASSTTYPGWGYMAENGATTIWELWNGNTANPAMNSGNHVMLLGDLLLWVYEYLGGISPSEPGFSKIRLHPRPASGLDHAECTYESVRGKIVSNWKLKGNKFIYEFEIPANTIAEVITPDGGTAEYGSGKYKIEVRL